MKIFKNFHTLVHLIIIIIIMDKKKQDNNNNKQHVTYFHEIIVDMSKLFTENEKTQENIQMSIYSVAGIFTGLALFKSNKKNEEKP